MKIIVEKAIIRYLKKHYPREMKKIIARSKRIRPKLAKRAPDIGGKDVRATSVYRHQKIRPHLVEFAAS